MAHSDRVFPRRLEAPTWQYPQGFTNARTNCGSSEHVQRINRFQQCFALGASQTLTIAEPGKGHQTQLSIAWQLLNKKLEPLLVLPQTSEGLMSVFPIEPETSSANMIVVRLSSIGVGPVGRANATIDDASASTNNTVGISCC